MKNTTLPISIIILIIVVIGWLTGCRSVENYSSSSAAESEKPKPPMVTDSSTKILFSWFEENTAKSTLDISEIPDAAKKQVRVQDLRVPPEKRNPDWIFLANLAQKNEKGQYTVRVVKRDKYEESRHPSSTEPSTPKETSSVSVLMYSTPHCPHCKKARRWLLEQKIPYKEIDIEQNQQAAAILAQKGQSQGVPTSGVPMFEINGRLIPGFDPAAIKQALSLPPLQTPPPSPMIPTPAQTDVPSSMPSPAPPSAVTI